MKFSTRARYGLRAMLELALNYDPNEPMPLFKIAEKQLISEGYLEQMMTVLRKGGLVRSVRGAQGGYLLSREPDRITAGEIIRCLEGPLGPTDCVSEEDPETCVRSEAALRGCCGKESGKRWRQYWTAPPWRTCARMRRSFAAPRNRTCIIFDHKTIIGGEQDARKKTII